MESIKLKNLSFSYKNHQVFNDISLSLPCCSCSIIGPSASGKTTLLKLIAGQEFGKGNIFINAVELNENNFKLLRRYIAIVFKSDILIKERVIDELCFPLENQNFSSKEITRRVTTLLSFFDLLDYEYRPINSLNYSEKLIIKILSYIIMHPKYLALDDVLCELANEFKEKLINYLKSEGIFLINVTTNMEELLLTDYVVCLYNHKIAFEGYTKKIFTEERIFKRLGLNLPFVIDLSLQLKYYGLVDRLYINNQELVEAIWK